MTNAVVEIYLNFKFISGVILCSLNFITNFGHTKGSPAGDIDKAIDGSFFRVINNKTEKNVYNPFYFRYCKIYQT